MKRLLNTLYIMTKESYLSLDGENVVVSVDKTEKARIPLHTLEGIICFNYGYIHWKGLFVLIMREPARLLWERVHQKVSTYASSRQTGNSWLEQWDRNEEMFF